MPARISCNYYTQDASMRGLFRNAVNYPSHPTVPWDHGITWDCPSYPTAPWDFPRDAHAQMHVSYCPFHPTVPWDHGTFHGMSTCPSTDACVLLSIPSHGPTTCPSHRHMNILLSIPPHGPMSL